MLQFTCGCGQPLKVSNDLAGWKTKCPGCKELVSVPSPDEPAPVEVSRARPEASIPWKGIAIGASCVALLAIIVAVASAGGGSPPKGDADADSARLKQKIRDLEKEVEGLSTPRPPSTDVSKLTDRVKALEAERDGARRELEGVRRQLDESRAAATASKPKPPDPGPAAPPAPAPAPSGAGSAPPATSAEVQAPSPGAVVLVQSDSETAGGFFVSKDGLIATSYRAIARSQVRRVTYVVKREGVAPGRLTLKAAVIAIDRKNDLALIQAAVPDLVPAVTLEDQFALGGGQEVTIFGTPIPDSESTEISVMRGKVVDIWAPTQGKPFIKTSIPVTSKVAGVPAFNVMGRVVGMTRLAPTIGDEDGYVIPAAHIRALIDGRETAFAVKGSLEEWESKGGKTEGAPAAGADPGPLREHPKGIRVDGHVTKLLVDDENDRIVALIPSKNSVSVASIARRKVLRSVITGGGPTDVQSPVKSDVCWVGHAGGQNLVKVDLEEGKVYDRVSVPIGFSQFVAARNHIWVFGPGDSGIVTLQDKAFTTSPMRFGAMAYDRRKGAIIAVSLSLGNTKIIEAESDKVGPLLRTIMEAKADPAHPRRKELDDLGKELESRLKKTTPPAECLELMLKGFRIVMAVDRSPHIYLGRTILKRERLDTVVSSFPTIPFENKYGPGVADAINNFGDLPAYIQAGSPDGKWIATGTHIYNTQTFAVHLELPIPTPTAAFSSDSKTLYIYDLSSQSIIPIDVEEKK